ncbi:MAG TPA: septal ring lytic transglycosylase RlpA family protein [Cellvibrionaceae bacterium]
MRVAIVCLLGVVLLAACSSKPQQPASRYSLSQDTGPDSYIDLSKVPDAVPRHETRTIAGNKNPYTVLGKTYHLIKDETSYKERGHASWYGKKFHGHKTSNGETYDMYGMTAAHKTLPIPSYVRVTNLNNNRSVVVRVNDRGPFHGGRIIDLSYAAAYRLGFTDAGTAPVEVEIIVPGDTPPPPLQATSGLYLQVGAFSAQSSAGDLQQRLKRELNVPVFISEHKSNRILYRVRVGPMANTQELNRVQQQLQRNGFDTQIVRQ